MTTIQLERRLSALEVKLSRIEQLLSRVPETASTDKKWIEEIWGAFSNDPLFEEAVQHGREWRDAENRKSLREPARRRTKKRR